MPHIPPKSSAGSALSQLGREQRKSGASMVLEPCTWVWTYPSGQDVAPVAGFETGLPPLR